MFNNISVGTVVRRQPGQSLSRNPQQTPVGPDSEPPSECTDLQTTVKPFPSGDDHQTSNDKPKSHVAIDMGENMEGSHPVAVSSPNDGSDSGTIESQYKDMKKTVDTKAVSSLFHLLSISVH